MPYDPDSNWTMWMRFAEGHSSNALRFTREWEEAYQDWQTFRAGRSNSQIATALGRSDTDIANLDAALAAFHAVYQFCANVAGPVAADRYYAWRLFA